MTDWYVDGVSGVDAGAPQGTGRGLLAFKTLQYAHDDARVLANDRILAAGATYTEDINITKAGLIVKRDEDPVPIVDGGFRLQEDGITIDSFRILNGRAGPTGDYPACIAADLDGSSGHKLINNVTVGAGADLPKTGIYTKNVTDVYIENNEVFGGSRGIVFLSHCDRTIVVHNNIHDSVGYGIGPGEFSPDCLIRSNDIHGNLDGGIQAYKSLRLTINLNNIYGNTPRGLSYYDAVDLDVEHNWWGAADGPGDEGPGSGNGIFCDHGAAITLSSWLIARAVHEKDLDRNTLVCIGKLAAGGRFTFRAPEDAYHSGLVTPTRARLEEASGRIAASFQGMDETPEAITLMAVGDPTLERYRAVLRTATKTYIVDV